MGKSKTLSREEAKKRIDNFIAEHDDWRGATMAQLRQIIHEVAPAVIEDWKYMGSPFWSHEGILGHGNIFKAKVKLTLHHGAHLPDPNNLFNASLHASQSRAIDIFEGEAIDVAALKNLLREAIAVQRHAQGEQEQGLAGYLECCGANRDWAGCFAGADAASAGAISSSAI